MDMDDTIMSEMHGYMAMTIGRTALIETILL